MFIALEELNPSMEGYLPGRNGATWVFDESDVFGTLTATRIYLLLVNRSIDFGSQSSFARKLHIFSKETLQYPIATETVPPGTKTDFFTFFAS